MLWRFESWALQVHTAAGWLLRTGVKLEVTVLTGAGLLDTTAGSGSLEGLMILGSGSGAGTGLGLLDIALEDVVLINLSVLGLGSGSQLDCSSLGEAPCATVIWSLHKLPSAICEERNSNGAF